MKYLVVSQADDKGGAARAAYRLFCAIKSVEKDSKMLVLDKYSIDNDVLCNKSKFVIFKQRAKRVISRFILNFQITSNPILHSLSLFSNAEYVKKINNNYDVVNLHWFNHEMLSIKDVSKIKSPLVLTLHDMWAFCGSEHLSCDDSFARFRCGYKNNNKPKENYLFDLDRYTWKKKKKYWRKDIKIVCPSNWLANCAKESSLFSSNDVIVIPNALNTNVFKPINKTIARDILGLDDDVIIIGFGSMGNKVQYHKGGDLLYSALSKLDSKINGKKIHLVVIGPEESEDMKNIDHKVTYLGNINSDIHMVLLYNAIDVMLVPSRQENLPQMATESQACGTPVCAFNVCGIPDAVEHMKTGYLAKPFSVDDFIYGIKWILNEDRYILLSENARNKAINSWSNEIVAEKYMSIFKR